MTTTQKDAVFTASITTSFFTILFGLWYFIAGSVPVAQQFVVVPHVLELIMNWIDPTMGVHSIAYDLPFDVSYAWTAPVSFCVVLAAHAMYDRIERSRFCSWQKRALQDSLISSIVFGTVLLFFIGPVFTLCIAVAATGETLEAAAYRHRYFLASEF